MTQMLAANLMARSEEGISAADGGSGSAPFVGLEDVEDDVTEFVDQYGYCSQNGLPMPCLESKGNAPLPINMAGIVYPLVRSSGVYQSPGIARALLNQLPSQVEELARASRLAYDEYSPQDTRNFFIKRLQSFLRPRVERGSPRGQEPGKRPGLVFKVFTETSGLRVHYTPAYWFNPNQIFGSPTSPSEGSIMPGRYRFGTAGRAHSLKFYDDEYNIPPQETAYLDE